MKDIIFIVLRGNIYDKISALNLYKELECFTKSLGNKFTHFAIKSNSYTTRNFVTIKMKEKRLLQAILNEDVPESIELYVVPEKYNTIAFDYILLFTITPQYILFAIEECFVYEDIIEKLLKVFRKHIKWNQCDICKMNKSTHPILYAEKVNPVKSFKTLTVIAQY